MYKYIITCVLFKIKENLKKKQKSLCSQIIIRAHNTPAKKFSNYSTSDLKQMIDFRMAITVFGR